MTTVSEILRDKGHVVHTVAADATIADAVKVMNDQHIGAVVVTQGSDVVGILTERDLLTRVLARQKDPQSTLVRDTMTRDVFWCSPETPLDDLRQQVRARRIRHVPVREVSGQLCGMVSIGDLNAFQTACLSGTVTYLEEYIARG
jgi:CBS domain-containing protein